MYESGAKNHGDVSSELSSDWFCGSAKHVREVNRSIILFVAALHGRECARATPPLVCFLLIFGLFFL